MEARNTEYGCTDYKLPIKAYEREKKQIREKRMETMIYGVFCGLFMMAFFFGLMFPEYGIVGMEDSTKAQSEEKSCLVDPWETDYSNAKAKEMTVTYIGEIGCQKQLKYLYKQQKNGKVKYASYFYDCLNKKS